MARPIDSHLVRTIFLLYVAGLAPSHAQKLVLHPSTIASVQLVGSDSPEYASLVDGVLSPKRQPATNDWLPYSVTLTNRAENGITGIAIRWVVTDATGRSTNLSTFDSIGLDAAPNRRIASGRTVVVLPSLMMLLKPLPSGSHDANDTPNHSQQLEKFTGAAMVDITLDGVLFDTGQFVGPDTGQEFERAVARWNAQHDMAADIISRRNNGQGAAAIVQWLQSMPMPSTLQRGQPHVQAPEANTRMMAMPFLLSYQTGGDQALYSMAESIMSASVQLHR